MSRLLQLTTALCLLLNACGGGGGGYGGGGGSGGSSSMTMTTVQPTLASIQANIFTPICTACHVGGSPPQGLNLEAGNAYNMLVGVASVEVPGLKRVAPGDPDNSYIVHKIEGTAAVGVRMPANGPPYLTMQQINAIRQWIANGALASFAGGSMTMQAAMTSPQPLSELQTAPAAITVAFSNEMDASRLDAGAVRLQGSGGDGSFAEGNEWTVSPRLIRQSADNPRLLVIDLGDAHLIADRYRLTISGSGDFAVLDLNGSPLDGDSDNIDGGDFQAEFSVAEKSG